MITGYRCAVCGTEVPVATPWPWRCPRSTGDDRRHVLRLVGSALGQRDAADLMGAFGPRCAWWWFAAAHGMSERDRLALAADVDAAVADVDGHGFRRTPYGRAPALSAALGFDAVGGVWVKDETGNVAGSHKARHLAGILLHLLVAEHVGVADPAARPPLAIASCGNAALAAATLARSVRWPLDVYVPPSADPAVLERLAGLGARIVPCPRRPDQPPGDPCVHAFRRAVDSGAVPFSVQGPENGLCLDTGRTIGWELADEPALDRVVVQVGGGALATCVGDGLRDHGVPARLHAVQTEGCAPLARAWSRARELGDDAAHHWEACMWPWEHEPRSAATGILDDETYDWLGIVEHLRRTGGSVVVVPEALVLEANDLAGATTAVSADHTGTAGLAGVLALRADIDAGERVAVVFSGVRRSAGS